MNRRQTMKHLIDTVDQGPSLDLFWIKAANVLPADVRREIEKELRAQYRRWAETWVLKYLEQVRASWCPAKSKAKPDRKRGA